jgi:hypothetical protein
MSIRNNGTNLTCKGHQKIKYKKQIESLSCSSEDEYDDDVMMATLMMVVVVVIKPPLHPVKESKWW